MVRWGLEDGSLLYQILDFEEQATVGRKEGGKDKRLDRHQLDEDVKGWSRCIFKRVPDGVTNNSCLVWI